VAGARLRTARPENGFSESRT